MSRSIYRDGGTGGGGAGGADLTGIWNGLIQQSPLHAKTDYFSDSSLDVKWTELDNDTNTTVTEDATGLTIVQTTHAGVGLSGIHEAAPAAAQYLITVDMRLTGVMTGVGGGSVSQMFVTGDLAGAPTTAPLVVFGLAWEDVKADVQVVSYSDYNSVATVHLVDVSLGIVRYFRIAVDNTANTFQFLVSGDGENWVRFYTLAQASASVTGDPVRIGFGLNNVNSGSTLKLHSRMFRVDESSDPFLPIGDLAA
jgi:hypothetical protein